MNARIRIGKFGGLLVLIGTMCIAAPVEANEDIPHYRDSDLRGQWVYSGDVKFAAPIPFPGVLFNDAPPHTQFSPGEIVGIWGSILGTMTFDGAGVVTDMKDVFKPGEVSPVPPFPAPYVPPLPEVGAGSYAVSGDGTVEINIDGRDPNSPEGQVDFEIDYHCQVNRKPRELICVVARFTTYFVDPNGYNAPISGIITFRKRN